MKIGYLQNHPLIGQNLLNTEKVIRELENTDGDLIVLPELFNTGYFMKNREMAVKLSETVDGKTISALKKVAATKNMGIVAGFAEKSHDKVFNSAVFIHPEGELEIYRKTHLFNDEKIWFDPGDTGFQVFSFRDVKIVMMICFDWIFPEAARSLALNGAQIIVHCANLVLPWCQDAMVTRSLENGVFTITANRIGTDTQESKSLTFTGRSQITDNRGKRLAQSSIDTEDIKTVEIDPNAAHDKWITPQNHLIKDRRIDKYTF